MFFNIKIRVNNQNVKNSFFFLYFFYSLSKYIEMKNIQYDTIIQNKHKSRNIIIIRIAIYNQG